MTNSTRRYPRTLVEAFGPYATLHVERKASLFDRFAIAIALVLFLATIGASVAVQLL